MQAGSIGQCGKGWTGLRKGQCVRSKPSDRASAIGHAIKHQGAHLAENVAAWKTGKVIGGAITALAASKGYDGDSVRILAETAVQATAATLISMRDKSKRTPEAIATKFVAESLAAMAGKISHQAFESAAESFNASEHFASIGALLSGKGAGISTNVTAMRSGFAATVARAVVRKRVDSADFDALGLSADQVLDLLVGAFVMLRRDLGAVREDAFVDKGLGARCGRGWVGIKGACRRGKKGKDATGAAVNKAGGRRLTAYEKEKAGKLSDRIKAEARNRKPAMPEQTQTKKLNLSGLNKAATPDEALKALKRMREKVYKDRSLNDEAYRTQMDRINVEYEKRLVGIESEAKQARQAKMNALDEKIAQEKASRPRDGYSEELRRMRVWQR